jgi:hypothetical protein
MDRGAAPQLPLWQQQLPDLHLIKVVEWQQQQQVCWGCGEGVWRVSPWLGDLGCVPPGAEALIESGCGYSGYNSACWQGMTNQQLEGVAVDMISARLL